MEALESTDPALHLFLHVYRGNPHPHPHPDPTPNQAAAGCEGKVLAFVFVPSDAPAARCYT